MSTHGRRRAGFAGTDFLGVCLTVLRDHPKWELALLVLPDLEDPRGKMARELSARLEVPIMAGKPNADWSTSIRKARLDALIVAGYKWRVPIADLDIKYALNVHPSLLPWGRGPNPLPHFFINEAQAAGVSIHKLTYEFDSGDIICQEGIDVTSMDVTDFYLEIVARARRLLGFVLDDIEVAYAGMTAQSKEGSWFQEISWEQRTFQAARITVAELNRLAEIFGVFGLSAEFPDGSRQEIVVRRTRLFDHGERGGRFVQWSQTRAVLQIADGYALVSMSSLI